jgi:hypothetical protein
MRAPTSCNRHSLTWCDEGVDWSRCEGLQSNPSVASYKKKRQIPAVESPDDLDQCYGVMKEPSGALTAATHFIGCVACKDRPNRAAQACLPLDNGHSRENRQPGLNTHKIQRYLDSGCKSKQTEPLLKGLEASDRSTLSPLCPALLAAIRAYYATPR